MPSFDAGTSGITGTIGVTILTAAGAVHTARATAGISEPVAGSGVYFVTHPDPGTLLLFVFDQGAATIGASCWDDGLTTTPARAGDAMTLTAEYDAIKTTAQASTALSSAVWTNTKAGYIDAAISDTALESSVAALGTPMQTGDATVAALPAAIAAIPTTPLLAASYTAPDNAGIAAILEDTGTTLPAAIETARDAVIAGSITGDTTINETTRLDAGGNIVASPLGTAIGPVTIEGVATGGINVTAYLTGTLTNPKRHCESESDGGWEIGLTPGAAYDVVFGQDDGIETPVTVTVIVE